MTKCILDFRVRKNIHLTTEHSLLILSIDQPLPEILPGQFAQVRIDNSPVFLRRPFSIHYVDKKKNELWLLIQVVGEGSRKLYNIQKNEILNLILPLGNSFSLPKNQKDKILVIGGGTGIAPLLFLGDYLYKNGFSPDFLFGARNKNYLIPFKKFETYGNVFITTEDGSMGEKGLVTHHSILKNYFDMIYCCGPTPMMKAVASYAEKNNISCEVSLENTMACGFGVCLCCVTDTTEGRVCVCTEGPVFNITKLKW